MALTADLPDTTSEAAEEGTHAHAALEHALNAGDRPGLFIGQHFHDRELTAETAQAIAVAYDYVMDYVEKGATFSAERHVGLSETLGRDDIHGTADITVMHPGGVPEVIDYKHGRGVFVDVKDNPQLQIYLLGVMEADGIDREVGGFTTIIQPRCPSADGPIRTIGYSPAQLEGIVDDITAAAALTDVEEGVEAALVPGETQCRWCKAKGTCPALAEFSLASSQAVFSQMPVEAAVETVRNELPVRETSALTPAEIAEILSVEPLISGWLKAVREHAIGELNDGRSIPGYKMVQGRKSRGWDKDYTDEQLLKWLAGKSKIEGGKVTLDGASDRKLMSPAQAEKRIKPVVTPKTWGNIIARIKQSEGNPVLAPETDARPAVRLSSADVFGGSIDIF